MKNVRNNKSRYTFRIRLLSVFLGIIAIVLFYVVNGKKIENWIITSIAPLKTLKIQPQTVQKKSLFTSDFLKKYRNFNGQFFETMENLNIDPGKIPAWVAEIPKTTKLQLKKFDTDLMSGETQLETNVDIPCKITIFLGEDSQTYKDINETVKTDHFLICYTSKIGNPHAVSSKDVSPQDGIPDYINIIAEEAEKTWNIQVKQWGFTPPKTTVEGLFEFQISNGGDGVAGAYLSYSDSPLILLNINVEEPWLRAVINHEFYHALQYSALTSGAILKMAPSHETDANYVGLKLSDLESTNWGKRAIRRTFIDERFGNPERHLGDIGYGLIDYGSYIFLQFLAEYTGTRTDDLIPELRQIITSYDDDIIEAYDTFLKQKNPTLTWEKAISDYHIWNLLSGPYTLLQSTYEGGYSNAADLWTTSGSVKIEELHTAFPAQGTLSDIYATGAKYVLLNVANAGKQGDTLRLKFTQPSKPDTAEVSIVKITKDWTISVEDLGSFSETGQFDISDIDNLNLIIFSVVNLNRADYTEYKKITVNYEASIQ